MKKSAFLIAATSSGVGKTTTTLGLLRALHNRGKSVQAFKSGPDYIDPKIIEGVMGLFDGFVRQQGSGAELAKKLNIPVVLVVNGKAVAYSMAALLYGYKNFDPKVKIAGVIFNNVRTESHYKLLKEAADSVGIESFGYIPRNEEITVPSRHLGLNIDEKYRFNAFADTLENHIQKTVDIDLILEKTAQTPKEEKPIKQPVTSTKNLKIGIAQDEAFNFMYPENVRKLAEVGEVVFFSPIKDKHLPEVDYLYLPGGYPEFFLEELSQNTTMLQEIKEFAENGGYIWAECGGMLYLCKEMLTENDTAYPLAGVLNLRGSLEEMKLKLGYRNCSYNGLQLRGHEFHYSSLLPHTEKSVAKFYSARNTVVNTELFHYKNVLAGYTHIYWQSGEEFLKVF